MLFKLLAGDAAQKQEVLATLRQLPSRCPRWLADHLANNTDNADIRVPACHVLRLYQQTRDALPRESERSFAYALSHMVNSKTWGSYYPFLRRYQDNVVSMEDSENHDMNKKSQQSLAVEVLASLPEFGPQYRLADGFTLAQHLDGWRAYWRSYFRNQALHGINVEVSSPVYNKIYLKSLTCLHDLTMDGGLQTLISDYLQVFYADVATEFLFTPSCSGIRGGAKARERADHRTFADLATDHTFGLSHMAWLLGWFGSGDESQACDDSFVNDTQAVQTWFHESASCFRPIPELRAIAHSRSDPFMWTSFRRGRASDWSASFHPDAVLGNFSTCMRDGSAHSAMTLLGPPRGDGKNTLCCEYPSPCRVPRRPCHGSPVRDLSLADFLNHTYGQPGGESTDGGLQYGMLRMTHVAQQYVLGTTDFAEDCSFSQIATQSVWMGAMFAASHTDRIGLGGAGGPDTEAIGFPVGRSVYSVPTGVTVPGASVVKRLLKSDPQSLYFFFSQGLLRSLQVTPDGWYCVQDSAAASFGCVRPVGNEGPSGVTRMPLDFHHHKAGLVYTLKRDSWAPIVVQLAPSEAYAGNFTKFIGAVQATSLHWDNSSGLRRLTYTSLLGNTIEMHGRSATPNKVDGDMTQSQCTTGPRQATDTPTYGGPFITGGGTQGRVTISSTVDTEVLDFTSSNPRHMVHATPSAMCARANPDWYNGNGSAA
jgi:hypothetical protein